MANLPNRTNEEYAQMFGDWVTARILKRIEGKVAQDPSYKLPYYVRCFLDGVSSYDIPGEVTFGPGESGWVLKTMDDPDWPEPEPIPPDPPDN
jgi:hypothetical protein